MPFLELTLMPSLSESSAWRHSRTILRVWGMRLGIEVLDKQYAPHVYKLGLGAKELGPFQSAH